VDVMDGIYESMKESSPYPMHGGLISTTFGVGKREKQKDRQENQPPSSFHPFYIRHPTNHIFSFSKIHNILSKINKPYKLLPPIFKHSFSLQNTSYN